MKIAYKVHSIAESFKVVTAEFNGQPIEAQIPALVVELVSDDGVMSHSFTFTDNLEEARALFTQDAAIEVSLAAPSN